MRAIGSAFLLSLAALSWSKMTMTTNLTEGQAIAGTFQFEVRVQSDALVTNVEFYVGNDLRSTDSSTPYNFLLDTLEEKQGEIKVTFGAYNADGESVKKTFTLKVDNGFDKGVDFHVDRANDFMTNSKFDDAIQACRVALKIDGKNNKARMAMARANFGKGQFDVAQKFAEDVSADDPSNTDAFALLSAISLRQAFNTTGSDSLTTISGALKSAAEAQFKVLEARSDGFGAANDSNYTRYADVMLRAHRYSRAISELAPRYAKDQTDNEVANRLMYAYIRSGRMTEAAKTLSDLERFGELDSYGFSIKAILSQYAGNTAASEEAEKEALLYDPTDVTIKFAQSYLALNRGKLDVLDSFLQGLSTKMPNDPRVNYYLSTQNYLLRNYEESKRRFELTLLTDPSMYDMLVERGHEIIEATISSGITGTEANARYELARAYFDAALGARPESFEALAGVSMTYNMLGKHEDARRFGQAAADSAPGYAGGQLALASAWRALGNSQSARVAADAAAKADARLAGRPLPNANDVWMYLWGIGRIPVIPAPGEYSN